MRISLLFNLFGKPAALAALGAVALRQGERLHVLGPPTEFPTIVGGVMAQLGPLLIGAAIVWALWGVLRLLRARAGRGIVCFTCGGPMHQRRNRWGAYQHCLNCGRNESLRH